MTAALNSSSDANPSSEVFLFSAFRSAFANAAAGSVLAFNPVKRESLVHLALRDPRYNPAKVSHSAGAR